MAEGDQTLTNESIVIAAMEKNKKRLDSCELPHNFIRINDNKNNLRCSKCKGYVTLSAGIYYIKGLKDGKLPKQEEGVK